MSSDPSPYTMVLVHLCYVQLCAAVLVAYAIVAALRWCVSRSSK